jgi:3-methylcrotonyl-CoA carboxylase alpha subunit
MVTGWDLVQQQIKLAAAGPTLAGFEKIAQQDIASRGAAIECRLYAENPAKNFFPSPGPLNVFALPPAASHLRVDTGVRQGDVITPFYDPMIAKMIVWGEDRDAALAAMLAALEGSRIEGVKNNLAFLKAVIRHEDFAAGRLDTGLVERERAHLLEAMAGAAPVAH